MIELIEKSEVVTPDELHELAELQLALVGGGNAVATLD
jgi:hypothetical protein